MASNFLLTRNQGRKKCEHVKKEAVLVEGEPGETLGCLPSASDTVDPILIIELEHLWWQYALREERVKGEGEWERGKKLKVPTFPRSRTLQNTGCCQTHSSYTSDWLQLILPFLPPFFFV